MSMPLMGERRTLPWWSNERISSRYAICTPAGNRLAASFSFHCGNKIGEAFASILPVQLYPALVST